MYLKCFFVLFATVFMPGLICAHVPDGAVPRYRQFSTFNGVEIKGVVDVDLHTGDNNPRLVLQGSTRDVSCVLSTVNHGILHVNIAANCKCCGTIKLNLYTATLNSFKYYGSGRVQAPALSSAQLDVVIENNAKTSLHGKINLRTLRVKGSGYTEISGIYSSYLRVDISGAATVKLAGFVNAASISAADSSSLSLYWLKSPELQVQARNSTTISLAGFVDKFELNLYDRAHFNGRYLHVDNAFIKTYGSSWAEISSLNHQHTLASDYSKIDFYNLARTRADFMADNGAVLDLRDLSDPALAEYSIYNK